MCLVIFLNALFAMKEKVVKIRSKFFWNAHWSLEPKNLVQF